MILSGGNLVLADTAPSFSNTYYSSPTGLNLTGVFESYQALYRKQLWVYVVVKKLALGTARLPLKVYRRSEDGRDEQRDSPFAKLLARPNPYMNPKHFIEWTVSTKEVFGEAMWFKVRGRDGRPAELWPIHPVNVSVQRTDADELVYVYHLGVPQNPKMVIPARDVVHFKSFNPDTTLRGMSPLEPLRSTLLNEDAARRATTALWRNGAAPRVALSHPSKLSQAAADRLAANWAALHGGVDNFGKTVVLEEGMEPKILSLNAEEAQYIETRKLNREEVVSAYDVPPPVVHILDHATFSNITEQMRSLYRDTMAPRLQLLEADIDFQLRPDFDDDTVYAEFLMDEVLRGDFESRVTAHQQSINSGWKTPAEVRHEENLPFIAGSDRLFINSAIIPIDATSARTSPTPPAEDVEPNVVPTDARIPSPAPPPIPAKTVRDVMGRLSRVKALANVDIRALTAGLNGSTAAVIAAFVAAADLADFKARIRAAAETGNAA